MTAAAPHKSAQLQFAPAGRAAAEIANEAASLAAVA